MKAKITTIILMILIIIITTIIVITGINGNKEPLVPNVETPLVEPTPEPVKTLQIIDLDSNTRPIAVMINNHKSAQPYQSGLNDAYIIYEMIVEGGITRMLALYKDTTSERIGPIRSARHYYLDYALENDALYAHHGWSPQAQSDISTYGISNIEVEDYKYGWRDNTINAPYEHTLFTSYDNLVKRATETYGYRLTSETENLLNYSIEELEFINPVSATDITLKYSTYQTNRYVYNEQTKLYEKYSNGTPSIDYVTKEPVTAKNIITYEVYNYSIPGDSSGRQELDNITSGSGYLFTNGQYIDITFKKASMSSQTKYYNLDGEEITVNDGITHIQIMPTYGTLTIN